MLRVGDVVQIRNGYAFGIVNTELSAATGLCIVDIGTKQLALTEDVIDDRLTDFLNHRDDHDKFWNITGRPDAHFANGYWWGTCTGYAMEIQSRLGAARVKVMGFHAKKNPRSEISEKVLDGHDFAIVDNRYIIDPWVRHIKVNGYDFMARGIYDMDNPADLAEIHRLYGDPDSWEEVK